MLKRNKDGGINEKQDRAGYAKNWHYHIMYLSGEKWHTENGKFFDRLDTAIEYANGMKNVDGIRIVQTTVTTVWDNAVESDAVL